MNLYRLESSDAKHNAQRNLIGRTHYVDDATLRSFHSRILYSAAIDNGLLFALVESLALDMHNTWRGYRYVIFDVFGSVVSPVDIKYCFKSRKAAEKAMWKTLDAMDALEITAQAIDRQERNFAMEIAQARATLKRLSMKVAA